MRLSIDKHLRSKRKALLAFAGRLTPKFLKAQTKNWQILIAAMLISIPLIILASLIFILKDLPAPATLTNVPVAQSTKILDRNGALLYNIFVSENRTLIPFSDIPLTIRQATISIEDKDFYKHGGVDIFGGILRALKNNLTGKPLEGGSTITQQLVKNSLLTNERTIVRKIKEAVLSFWTEKIYTKDQILTMYLNRIPYGGTAYGIEEASQVYFNKHAKDLTLSESAFLAGLPAAPTFYSPFGLDPNRAITRQHQVLQRMVEDGYISKDQYLETSNQKLALASPSTGIKAPHFVAYVKEMLVNKYGEAAVEQGGLKVTTSLDLQLQDAAQASLSAEVIKEQYLNVGNGAALVTNPGTGEILAMVGSTDYFSTESGNVNVILANRSPGSSIKPLNYALGFLKGTTTPATAWIDASFCFPPYNGKSYCPQNYDNKFHGVVQTRFALGNSFNIPAVKELALNTVPDFIATASAMGLTTLNDDPSRYGYSLTLGGGEIKMIDMAVAFGVFANNGRRQNLVSILKVENSNGKILEEINIDSGSKAGMTQGDWDGTKPWVPKDNWVLPKEVTFLISHILLDDGARSETFGSGSILNVPGQAVSVKTGTTDDKRDNWTIGYTPSILVAVWVGNNDNSPMSPYLESGNTGAAPIWNKIMRFALQGKKTEWPQKPDDVVFTEICSLSGLIPDHNCPTRGEYFIKAFVPRQTDNVWDQKKSILVYKDSHKQPGTNDKPNPDQLTNEDHVIVSDPFQKDFCVDCPQ